MASQERRAVSPDGRRPAVGMIAPTRDDCGVATYTRALVDAMGPFARIAFVTEADAYDEAAAARADIVHVQHEYFLFGGVAPWKSRFHRFARRVSRPAVLTAHEFVSPQGSPWFRAALAVTNRRAFQDGRFRRIIVHTEADRQRMVAAGVAGERLVVVRHGVPEALALPPRQEALAALGLPERVYLNLPGFISRRKGHLFALEALSHLPPAFHLLIAGGKHPDDRTDYFERLQSAISERNLDARVTITGYLTDTDLRHALAITDIVVSPFTESSGSGSLSLAFAARRPIAASDIEPHREISADTPGSLELYPREDAGALAAAIQKIHACSTYAQGLEAGAARYAEQHSFRRVAEATVEIYRGVLTGDV